MTLPAQDIVERLRERAKRMNGALVGASDGGTYALGYYDQFAAADDKEAAATISRLTADNEALRKERDEARANVESATELQNDATRLYVAAEARAAEARRLLANSLKEYAPISAASHRSEVQAFLARAALANEEAGR